MNLVDEALAEAMNITAIDFPAQKSEIAAANLALASSTDVKVPRIASAPAALECRWVNSVSITADRELLLGEVVRAWTRDGVMDDKLMSISQLISRSGGSTIASTRGSPRCSRCSASPTRTG